MKYHLLTWLSLAGLSACGPGAGSGGTTGAGTPAATMVVKLNDDSTRTVARQVNGLLEGRTTVYRPDHSIESIFYFRHDSAEGIQRRFYPSGHVASWQQLVRGRLQGPAYEFAPDGALLKRTTYVAGQRQGRSLAFYGRPRWRLYQDIEYRTVDGHEWKTHFVEYDTLGRLVQRYGFLVVRAARDTVRLGDSLTLYVRERYPKHRLAAVVVGDFDARFHLRDSASLGSLQGPGHAATLRLPTTRRGAQVVRGYLQDYDERSARQPGGTVAVAGQRLYFAFPYFVR